MIHAVNLLNLASRNICVFSACIVEHLFNILPKPKFVVYRIYFNLFADH